MNNNTIESIEWHKDQLSKLLSDEIGFYKVESEIDSILEKAKKRIQVKGTAKVKAHTRTVEVGRSDTEEYKELGIKRTDPWEPGVLRGDVISFSIPKIGDSGVGKKMSTERLTISRGIKNPNEWSTNLSLKGQGESKAIGPFNDKSAAIKAANVVMQVYDKVPLTQMVESNITSTDYFAKKDKELDSALTEAGFKHKTGMQWG